MKKIFLSFSLIVVFALFATFSRRNVGISADRFLTPTVSILDTNTVVATEPAQPSSSQPSEVPVTSEPVTIKKPVSTPVKTPVTTKPIPTPTPVPTPKSVGQYKDGSYTGSVADAYYGYIQVKAIISGGKLSDVVFLQYPNDRRTSIEINTQAMGYLKTEALQAQSARVDIVSGASDSSQAFIESLGVALAMAKN